MTFRRVSFRSVILLPAVPTLVTGTNAGGMKRRLAVGIASIAKPRILFLDEPSTGMVRAGLMFHCIFERPFPICAG